MPRPRNKEDLLTAAKENYSKLMDFIASMSDAEMKAPLIFLPMQVKKKPTGAATKMYATF